MCCIIINLLVIVSVFISVWCTVHDVLYYHYFISVIVSVFISVCCTVHDVLYYHYFIRDCICDYISVLYSA
jgi:hypothetical protein